MIKTYETTPQVIVTVDGLPAACHNMTCGFTYTKTTTLIKGITYDGSSKKLSLTGYGFPSKASDMQKIEYAKTPCKIDPSKQSETTMECTLTKEPTCGKHLPFAMSRYGQIPIKEGKAPKEIKCFVKKIEPATDLNLFGGDNITFTGTNFPHELATSTFALEFGDTQKTKCTV